MKFKKFTIKGLFLMIAFSTFYSSIRAGEIIQISASTRHLIPEGKEVDAIDGDWILRNDKVVAVIGGAVAGRDANVMVPSVEGAVIDFTSLKTNDDLLVVYYPQGYKIGAMSAQKIEVVRNQGSEIVLRTIREASEEFPYRSMTEYTLVDGEDFLRVKTTHHNTGDKPVMITVTDNIRLDHGIADASPVGNTSLAFIFNKWFKGAYGIYSRKGLYIPSKPVKWGGRKGGISIQFEGKKGKLTLKPGEQLEVERFLLCGEDVAQLQKNVADREDNASMIIMDVADTNEVPVADALVEVLDPEGAKVSFAFTDEAGSAELTLNPGKYQYLITKVGHDTIQHSFSVGAENRISATLKPLTSFTFSIEEADTKQPIPAKIKFTGINGTSDPFLGSKNRAEGAENLYYSFGSEPFQVPVSPGTYLVTVSHGPEFSSFTQQVQIKRGENKSISVTLSREYSTPNWIIADFHNHTTVSGDNSSEVRSRIINMAAAGIEFAPATEHNRISSFTDEIKKIGLQEYIASCPGIELSGLPGPGAINHQNAFPLLIQEDKQGSGFPGTNADPYLQMKGLYDYDNKKFKFIQQNHPDVPWLYFDKDQNGILDQGFGTRSITHAMELNNTIYKLLAVTSVSATATAKENKVFQWLQMLNQGDRIYGTANSDNHVVSEGSGSRFNYVYSKEDDPAKINAVDIAQNARAGHIIMSNGPFINVDINGSLPGDEVKADQSLDIKINIAVLSPFHLEIDRVQLLVNGRQHKEMNFTRAEHPQFFSDGNLQFRHSLTLPLDKDAHVIVVATGPEKRDAIAVANPFFIDVDGNGFEPNRDLLGKALPVK